MDKRDGSAASSDSSTSKPNKGPRLSSRSTSVNDTPTSKSKSVSTAPSSTIIVESPVSARDKVPDTQNRTTPARKKRCRSSKERSSLSSLSSKSTPKPTRGASLSNTTTPKSTATNPPPSSRGVRKLRYVVYKRISTKRNFPYAYSKHLGSFTNLIDANNKVARQWKEEHSTGFTDYVKDKETDDRLWWAAYDRDTGLLEKVEVDITGKSRVQNGPKAPPSDSRPEQDAVRGIDQDVLTWGNEINEALLAIDKKANYIDVREKVRQLWIVG